MIGPWAGIRLQKVPSPRYKQNFGTALWDTTMIKAVLWDFGGVLTTSPFEAFNRYEDEQNLPRDFIRSVNATNPNNNAWAQLESSQIDVHEFDELFARETSSKGHEIRGKTVLELLAGDLRPNMVQALRIISTRYKTGCLTNNIKGAGQGAGMQATTPRAARVQSVMDIFDIVIESSKVGYRKPNPEFYTVACKQLDISPNEAVFLDDLGVNLKPARELGMTTIKVVDPIATIRELEGLLDMTLME